MNNRNKVLELMALIIILLLAILICIVVLGNMKKTVSESQNSNSNLVNSEITTNSTKTYNVSDYVEKNIFNYHGSTLEMITFKNINEGLTYDFLEKLTDFEDQMYKNYNNNDGYIYTRNISAEVNENILSIYALESISGDNLIRDFGEDTAISLNIDLSNLTIIDNKTFFEKYHLNNDTLWTKILNELSENITTSSLLKSTDGDITADKISMLEFKNNIPTYAKQLENRYSKLTFSIQNSKPYCSFKVYEVLAELGLGSHMGIGLNPNLIMIPIN